MRSTPTSPWQGDAVRWATSSNVHPIRATETRRHRDSFLCASFYVPARRALAHVVSGFPPTPPGPPLLFRVGRVPAARLARTSRVLRAEARRGVVGPVESGPPKLLDRVRDAIRTRHTVGAPKSPTLRGFVGTSSFTARRTPARWESTQNQALAALSPRISWRTATTSAPFRSCLVTGTSARRWCTHTW